MRIEQLMVSTIDSIDFEGDITVNPNITETTIPFENINPTEYIYLPVNQMKGNMIIQALEPKSMLSLFTYKQLAHLLKPHEKHPVLRVIKIHILEPIH